jgi:hypothetical protein
MVRKSTLADALKAQAGHATSDPVPHEASTAVPPSIPPSRQGKKTIAGHFDPAVSRQLREIALAEDSSMQELLREAINDLLIKRGRPPIA